MIGALRANICCAPSQTLSGGQVGTVKHLISAVSNFCISMIITYWHILILVVMINHGD